MNEGKNQSLRDTVFQNEHDRLVAELKVAQAEYEHAEQVREAAESRCETLRKERRALERRLEACEVLLGIRPRPRVLSA